MDEKDRIVLKWKYKNYNLITYIDKKTRKYYVTTTDGDLWGDLEDRRQDAERNTSELIDEALASDCSGLYKDPDDEQPMNYGLPDPELRPRGE